MSCGQGRFSVFLLSRYTYGERFTLYTHVEQTCPYENSVYIILPTVVSRYQNIVYMYIVEEV